MDHLLQVKRGNGGDDSDGTSNVVSPAEYIVTDCINMRYEGIMCAIREKEETVSIISLRLLQYNAYDISNMQQI
jgi:hypothetical protein